MKTYFAILAFLLSSTTIYGQERTPALFLHTDKSIYTGHEIIWFTAYVLNAPSYDSTQFSALFVTLSDPIRKKQIFSGRFVVSSGIAAGVLQLPDSLPAGEYSLVAYTDHLFGHATDAIFHSWISVRYSSSSSIPFFRHPDDSLYLRNTVRANISTDSSKYAIRTKTKWKIHLTDSNNQPVRGLFSVACVRESRLKNHFTDIRGFDQSCFSLPGLIADTMPPFEARVGYGNKSYLKSLVRVLVAANRNLHILQTEDNGRIILSPAILKGDFGTNVMLSVMPERKETQEFFNLTVVERDKQLNAAILKRQWPLRVLERKADPVFSDQEQIVDKKTLEAVVVKAKPIAEWLRPEYNELPIMDGPCAAWVCSCGHWKCGGCPPLHAPVKGVIYEDRENHKVFKYTGCPLDTVVKPFIKKINPVTYARAFQATDFSQEHPDGLFLNSTLYWNYLITTDTNGDASFEFYTNDLLGVFQVAVQGVTAGGLISDRKSFIVYDPDGK